MILDIAFAAASIAIVAFTKQNPSNAWAKPAVVLGSAIILGFLILVS